MYLQKVYTFCVWIVKLTVAMILASVTFAVVIGLFNVNKRHLVLS